MSMDAAPQLMTVEDIAAMAQISSNTIQRWVREGKFPKPRKIGRASRWPRDEVERFLDSAPRAA